MFHKQILHIITGIVQCLSNNSLFVTNLANIINLKSYISVTNQYITTCQLYLDFKHTNLYLILLLTLWFCNSHKKY